MARVAHILPDVQYTIDRGDSVVELTDSTLAADTAKAERCLNTLLGAPAFHLAGRELLRQIKAWHGKVFAFLHDRCMPPNSNANEEELRSSVAFGKVTNGFRSDWATGIHTGYCSVIGTARRQGQST